MTRVAKQAALNRTVFTQTTFESRALTVLTTLLHRFNEPGRFQVLIRHPSRPVRELVVRVSKEASKLQVNLDLAGSPASQRGCCDADDDIEVAVGGVVGFYPSSGVDGYRVTIARIPARVSGAGETGEGHQQHDREEPGKERLELDNEAGVPVGDLFSVVLARPGRYLLTANDARANVVVALPQRERLRTDQPTLVRLSTTGFEPASLELLAGRAVVVLCEVPAGIKVEFLEPESGQEKGRPRKYSYRKPRPTAVNP